MTGAGWIRGGAGIALGAGVGVWVGWLVTRRRRWYRRLNDAIPVNSAYWRTRGRRDGEVLYVALGDSAGQGIGASKPGRGYVGALARLIGRESGRAVRVVNLAISGATTYVAVRDELPKLARLQPDVCTIAIGANDIAGWDPLAFERNIRRLFAALPAHTIVAELPSFHFLPGERNVRSANRVLHAVAEEHGLVVAPLYADTRRQGLRGILTQFAGDLFHPNDRGYDVWAAAFAPAVAERARAVAVARNAAE